MATQSVVLTPEQQKAAAEKKAADAAAADAAAKAEVARKAAAVASTAPAKPLTSSEIVSRMQAQLASIKNPNHTSDMTRMAAERIEALLELLVPMLPVVKA
jgi:hypothetical protein